MDSNERQEILDRSFPQKQSGFNRPAEITADFPYSDTFPAFSERDKVINSLMNLVIRQVLSNDEELKRLINELAERFANADLQLVTQAVKGLMRPEDKKKLDEIEEHATNYKHPNVGKAGTYTKVTTDSQGHIKAGENPTTLAGYGITDAAMKSHGYHVPTPEKTVSNSRFLRNDNTWQDITPGQIGAALASHNHNDLYYTKPVIDSLLSRVAYIESHYYQKPSGGSGGYERGCGG